LKLAGEKGKKGKERKEEKEGEGCMYLVRLTCMIYVICMHVLARLVFLPLKLSEYCILVACVFGIHALNSDGDGNRITLHRPGRNFSILISAAFIIQKKHA
jgi:hypothetical protein